MSNIDKQVLIAKIKKQTESFDTVVLHEDEANALLDELEAGEKRIAELEAREVTPEVGVMNIGNPYCEDRLVAWTVAGKSLPPGIYYLAAVRTGSLGTKD